MVHNSGFVITWLYQLSDLSIFPQVYKREGNPIVGAK